MTRYIFVTGGVVSSLGKGIISASIGKLLQARGYSITIQKFDPYINIDPGTLNPYEHGECYVTVDGTETDLDLGHYERFTGIRTTQANSVTTGKIYKAVIDMMEDQKTITNMGGTMRLGAYGCELRKGSKVAEIYGEQKISERHRHRYEFNNSYKDEYEKNGMQCVGTNPESGLVEIVEIPNLRWYIGTQFHPEYSSTVLKPHPLFLSFVKECNK